MSGTAASRGFFRCVSALVSVLGTALVAYAQVPHGHGMNADDAALRAMLEPPQLAEQAEDPALPPGKIVVHVVHSNGEAVAAANVDLGIMAQGGDRNRIPKTADEDGVVEYPGLPTQGQAYRVNVRYQGATYSSNPFQLPRDHGYRVTVHAPDVTTSDQALLQVIGRVAVELADQRLHVSHQLELANTGERTIVLPPEGLRIRLPEAFLNMRTERVMSDQRVEEVQGEGVAIRGSFPRGRTVLTFAYDVRTPNASTTLRFSNPFRTFSFQTIVEKVGNLRAETVGFAPPTPFEREGHTFLVTELQRAPTDAPLSQVEIRLRGLPTPGPMRWIAVGLAVLLVLGMAIFAVVTKPAVLAASFWQSEREALLAQMQDVMKQRDAGEIGPETYAQERDRVRKRLAALLRSQQLQSGQPKAGQNPGKDPGPQTV